MQSRPAGFYATRRFLRLGARCRNAAKESGG